MTVADNTHVRYFDEGYAEAVERITALLHRELDGRYRRHHRSPRVHGYVDGLTKAIELAQASNRIGAGDVEQVRRRIAELARTLVGAEAEANGWSGVLVPCGNCMGSALLHKREEPEQ